MVLHGLKRIFQKPTPDLSSSERTNQLRSKTVYSGTVNLSTALATSGSSRYKTYNGPFELVNENGNGSLVASASYSDLLDITKGKVLLNKLPLTDLTYPYYENNFGNGEIYVGNYQQFDGSFFSGSGPTGCADSVLVYDISTTGFTGPGSYTGNSIGNTGVTGTVGSNQDIFVDPKHCYYSDPCASSASYMKFVDINFKGPTGQVGATGITGPSQYYAQKIINGDQYSGFRFPMSNFTLTCTQQKLSQTDGPIFCPLEPPSLSNFNIPPQIYNPVSFSLQITPPPQSNSSGAFTYYSSNHSVATISGSTITIVGAGTSTITAIQAAVAGYYTSGSISTPLVVIPIPPTLSSFVIPNPLPKNFGDAPFALTPPSSDSLGTFSYTSSSASVTISGNIVTIVGIDSSIIITATQAASGGFGPGSIQAASFAINPIPPTLSSFVIPNPLPKNFGDAPFALTPPSSDSLGTFSYTSSSASVTISGNIVTIVGIDSSIIITATQAASGGFGPGSIQAASFAINPIPPTLSFTIQPKNIGYPPFILTEPTSDSSGTFTYSISVDTPPVATISGSTVTIDNVGNATITALQAASGGYTSGSIQAPFSVIPALPSFWQNSTGFPNPVNSIAYLRTGSPNQYIPARDWTAYYESASPNCCIVEATNDTQPNLKWKLWWNDNSIPIVKGFVFKSCSLDEYNTVCYIYGSFDKAQLYDGSGAEFSCGCIAQIRNGGTGPGGTNMIQMTQGSGYWTSPIVGVCLSGLVGKAIVNDAVAIATETGFVDNHLITFVGKFDSYILLDGTKRSGVTNTDSVGNLVFVIPPVSSTNDDISFMGATLGPTATYAYETNEEIYQVLVNPVYTTYPEVELVGKFTSTAGGLTTVSAVGYVKLAIDNATPTPLQPQLPSGSVVNGISVSATNSAKRIIYGGIYNSITSEFTSFAYSLDQTAATTPLLPPNSIPPSYIGGLNGSVNAQFTVSTVPTLYDILGLFNPLSMSTIDNPMLFWSSSVDGTWEELLVSATKTSNNKTNNGAPSNMITQSQGQGLFFNSGNGLLYMNGSNNSDSNCYNRYLDFPSS